MGMAGAYLLADELYEAKGDYKVAFAAYQQRLKPEMDRRQKDARGLVRSFVPRNNFEIAMRISYSTLLCFQDSVLCLPNRLEQRA